MKLLNKKWFLILTLMMIFSVSEGQQPKTCVTYFNNPSFEGWKFFLPGVAPPEWSTGDTTSQIVALPEGKYGYMVTDSNGCSVSGEVSIINTHEFNVFIPNAFTPNGDGNNDYLEAFGNRLNWKKMSIQIFSREGTLVFESNQPDFKWDGKYMGQSLSSGVYVYVFKVTYLDTHVDEMRNGSITIIK